MIYYKTEEEIELLRESSLLVGKTLAEVAKYIEVGIKTIEIDKIAESFIRANGAVPGFKGYRGFPNTLCISLNDAVVHGIPDDTELKEGDIVSIDCGVLKNDFYGDSAFTFTVGDLENDKLNLLKVTRESLMLGIEQAVAGNRLGDISFAIQQHAEKYDYGVVRELVGHGLGRNLHEKPEVPNYGRKGKGMKLKENLVIAIEPMINMGKKEVKFSKDGWTVKTIDGKASAHFEHDVVVRKGKAEVLSTFDYIEEVLSKKRK